MTAPAPISQLRRWTLALAGASLGLGLCACAATPPKAAAPKAPPPPLALAAKLDALGRTFNGKVGIAVLDLNQGWLAAYEGDSLFPQQSVSKLWVATAVFDAIDKGRMHLADPVLVTRDDMSVFNQPIQKSLDADGRYQSSIDDLLGFALSKSDNAADDILNRKVGGPAVVRAALAARHLDHIRPGPELKVLESQVAGIAWKPVYSFGEGFYEARDKVEPQRRIELLDRYVADPADGASPKAIVSALARLKKGELLSPASTKRFLELLDASTTGPMRLKAGIGEGWSIGHKTGTGQDLGAMTTGYNDVGLITAPDGRTYAVAVMMAATRVPIPERQSLMAAVAAAVVAEHDHPGS